MSSGSAPRPSAATWARRPPASACPPASQSLGLTVSVLVNNAGFATGGAFYQSDPARELDQVRVLVEAPMALCSAFLPEMVRRGSGAVLNVASTAGMQPLPYSAGYSAAKAYMLTFSEALHEELKGAGVTVTALAPGPGLDRVLGRRRLGGGQRPVVREGRPQARPG